MPSNIHTLVLWMCLASKWVKFADKLKSNNNNKWTWKNAQAVRINWCDNMGWRDGLSGITSREEKKIPLKWRMRESTHRACWSWSNLFHFSIEHFNMCEFFHYEKKPTKYENLILKFDFFAQSTKKNSISMYSHYKIFSYLFTVYSP